MMGWSQKVMFVLILMNGMVLPVVASTPPMINQGVFTLVQGKVQVQPQSGHQTEKAQKEMTVFEGDRVITGHQSSASIRFFDGSILNISPNTQLVISKLQKPAPKSKILQFELIIGKILAVVTKLTTADSSFEVEAGGVVCGVRGTQFSVSCDGQQHPQVSLQVLEGVVYAVDKNGTTYLFHPGPWVQFFNGLLIHMPKPPVFPHDLTGLHDLNDQFKSQVGINQGKTLTNTNLVHLIIKAYVGN